MIYELAPISPTEQQPGYEYDVDLSGVVYRIGLQWRDRTQRWYISLWDSAGEALLLGKMLVPGYPVGWKHTGRMPTGGTLLLLDADSTGEPCTYEDLGRSHLLVWITSDEFTAPASPYSITVEELGV